MATVIFKMLGGAIFSREGCVSKSNFNSSIVALQSCPGLHHILQT